MNKKVVIKDHDLIIFSVFSLIFAVILEYFAYIHIDHKLNALSWLAFIGGIGFIFVSFYSLIKLKSIKDIHFNEIDRVSKFDNLTGIPNIYFFLEEINRRIKSLNSLDENRSLYLINIGINRFKFINETFGYSYADKIIVLLKTEILKSVQSDHFVGKLNGDEFGVLIIGNKSDLMKAVDSIKDVFDKEYKVFNDDVGVFVNGRLGITKYHDNGDEHDSSPLFMIRKSVIALDYAKKEGLFYKLYNKTLEKENDKIMEMENDLRLAINNNEIDVFFQPKISIKTGKVIGAEALARWFSVKRNAYIPPDIFIEMAENIGIINPIGNYILNKSAVELKKWHNLGFKDLKVAVNVSTHQFKKELPDEIAKVIKKIKLRPLDLEIEVTESSIIRDKDSGVNLLKRVHSTGVTIAIDDFGTGYSSLAYLVEFPLDVIKIDKSFIDKLIDSDVNMRKKGENVISTIINLSHSIGCKVVAEGVEKQEQIDFLKQINCDYIQGYYYSKPLNSKDFILYLNKLNS